MENRSTTSYRNHHRHLHHRSLRWRHLLRSLDKHQNKLQTKKMMVLTTTSSTATTAFGIGEVHPNPPAIELLLVEVVNGGISLLAGAESDKAKSARATSLTIPHHDGLRHIINVSAGKLMRDSMQSSPRGPSR